MFFPHLWNPTPSGAWFTETVKLRKYTFAELTSGSEVGFLNNHKWHPQLWLLHVLIVDLYGSMYCMLFVYVMFMCVFLICLAYVVFQKYFEFWASKHATGRLFLMLLDSKDSRKWCDPIRLCSWAKISCLISDTCDTVLGCLRKFLIG